MPRHASSRSLGTRRAHPSAKFTPRAISAPSPQGHLTLARPPRRGGLRTPVMSAYRQPNCPLRPATGLSPTRRSSHHTLARPPPYHPGAETAPLRENHLPRHLPPLPPKATPPWLAPLEGRAPHARDDGITSTELPSPSGHRPLANSSIIATCLGLPPAVPPGRGDRAPPRKPPPAPSPAPSPQGPHPLALPSFWAPSPQPSPPPHPGPPQTSPPPCRKKFFSFSAMRCFFPLDKL
jgi:hypothetical protein